MSWWVDGELVAAPPSRRSCGLILVPGRVGIWNSAVPVPSRARDNTVRAVDMAFCSALWDSLKLLPVNRGQRLLGVQARRSKVQEGGGRELRRSRRSVPQGAGPRALTATS